MGREIRMVPPHWEHPVYPADEYHLHNAGKAIPMYDETFVDAVNEWKRGLTAYEAEGPHDSEYWESWAGPPCRENYRPAFAEEPTWFQVYQTVSEGTPVTPPFATSEELIDYLVENGDFACQERGNRESPPSREAATAFVNSGYVPSATFRTGPDGVTFKSGISQAEDI